MTIFQRIYEGIMVILVMITIMTLWMDTPYFAAINWGVWFIFFVDFLVRFLHAKEKWEFLKKNPLLVVAIIPFDQFFQIARIVRVIYLFRIKTITKYYIQPFVEKLSYQKKAMIFLVLLGILSIQALLIYGLEENATTIPESFFYVIGHLMFFGHEIFVVNHEITIGLLSITSIIGIALHGLAIQWVFTKLEELYHKLMHMTNE